MNKRGFSLVELLAVIVILGVLAVITAPIITGVIEDSRISGFKSSLTGMKKAIETDYSEHKFDTTRKYRYSNKKLMEITTNTEIEVSGHINGTGKGAISASGTVTFGAYNEKYCGITIGSDVKLAGEDGYTYDACKAEVEGIN